MDRLPDPVTEPAFYDGVPLKRLIAWVVDVAITAAVTVVALPLTLFAGLFFLPLLYGLVGFLYRWASITRMSGTIGMRLAAIELRGSDGGRLDPLAALLHTSGYTASVMLFPAQFVSVALMMVTPRRQSLTDLVLGTAAVRQAAVY
ncbi:RDD family protein [Rhodobacteraceae bacterium MCCB 386]|nr:RDD family protein [Roseitranquillus sediminis]